MKYSLLSVQPESSIINIGDYVQALASSQFLPSIDGFIEREKLNQYNGDVTKMIMNGWFMHHPDNWPPSENIKPLFVAFHINILARESLLSDKSIAYLKRHEPIGCRDIYTRDLLIDKGINAYFSGCMTLTLGNKYNCEEKDGSVYFVDAAINKTIHIYEIALLPIVYLFNFRIINKIYKNSKNFEGSYCTFTGLAGKWKYYFKKWIRTVKFYKSYKRLFKDEILENANFVCHQSSFYSTKYKTNEELLGCAEQLVKKYARASLVITSRIHCALPCLGLNTPVLYVYDKNQSKASSCRMNGLVDLFNTINIENGKISNEDNLFESGKIGYDNIPVNKTTWKVLADSLIDKTKKWIAED